MKYIKEKLDFEKWIPGNLYRLDVHGFDKEKNVDVSGLVFVVKLESVINIHLGMISGICVYPDEYKGRFMPIRREDLVKLFEPSKDEVVIYNFLMDARKYNL